MCSDFAGLSRLRCGSCFFFRVCFPCFIHTFVSAMYQFRAPVRSPHPVFLFCPVLSQLIRPFQSPGSWRAQTINANRSLDLRHPITRRPGGVHCLCCIEDVPIFLEGALRCGLLLFLLYLLSLLFLLTCTGNVRVFHLRGRRGGQASLLHLNKGERSENDAKQVL